MAQYEHLFSKDPIGAFEKIKQDYLRYFRTMYGFENKTLDTRKNELIEKEGVFSKEPFLELTPRYEAMEDDLAQICKNLYRESNTLPDGFAEFIARGMMIDEERSTASNYVTYKPYKHQYEMLCKGYGQGNNVIITSGTGSGKTESFMLPVLASLLKEAKSWNDTYGGVNYNPCWWQTDDGFGNYVPNQRTGENRPSAIRGLLLYPINTLVADQVSRLRKTLDSDAVREYLDNQCGGHRIFFGNYTGKTIKGKTSTTHNNLKHSQEQSVALENFVASGKGEKDDIYVAPRLSYNSFTSEMLVREDMQEHVPDLLITNVSMLSIILMRYDEQGMLDQTAEYYRNNPDAVFHLVIDELHLHRGTSGAEVAFLLRMFLERIGVPPMKDGSYNKQLRIYASSASIANDVEQYLEDFFGVYDKNHPFVVQPGYDVKVPSKDKALPLLDYNAFSIFYDSEENAVQYYEMDADGQAELQQKFLKKLNYLRSFQDFVEDYSSQIYLDLQSLTQTEAGSNTFAFSNMKSLPGNPDENAIRGFLIFRGSVKNALLPSIRFHQFYKYIEGLWGELLPDKEANGPIGELMFRASEVSSNGQHKVLELLRCECCGELFIGGNRSETNNGTILLTLNDPQINKIPNMQATPMVQKKTYKEYVVFWPSASKSINGFYGKPGQKDYEHIGLVDIDGNHSSEGGDTKRHGAWRECWLNPYDGSLQFAVLPQIKFEYIHGYVYFPRSNNQNSIQVGNLEDTNRITSFVNKDLKALPCKCPACEKDYLYRKYTQSPIRSFRTGMGRNNQLLSKELLYQLDSHNGHAPKLIGFSDSRQDAAEQSKLIAIEHYRDMLRLGFIQILNNQSKGGVSTELQDLKDDLVDDFCKNNPVDRQWRRIQTSTVSTTDKQILQEIVKSSATEKEKTARIKAYIPVTDTIDLDKLISTNGKINGDLVKVLLDLGVNPAGADHEDMYPIDEHYWDTYYDFTSKELKDQYEKDIVNNKTFLNYIYDKMQSHIFENCFGQYMNVNTEASGLGYVFPKDLSGLRSVNTLKSLIQPYLQNENLTIENVLSAFIRVFGDAFRYDGQFLCKSWKSYEDYSGAIKKVVRALAEKCNIIEKELGKALHQALKEVALDPDGKLKLTHPLRFKLAKEDDQYYLCPKCKRVHLHRGFGFCTNPACREDLTSAAAGHVKDLWEENYISFDVKKEPHTAKRLHSEELSGQTDDQMSRLLKFKDIVIEDNCEEKANQIDMLSVTTTMEVGVDIGSLQAIYQGNMPPTRYNYQQRVGRAGRRGQAYSAAITFCRGRSHDNHYFYNATAEMTGGKPADPTIAVNPNSGNSTNLVILKRIILKHILMEISSRKQEWATTSVGTGTSGQLGGAGAANWDREIFPEIKSWIQRNTSRIEEIIKYYLSQYFSDSAELNQLVSELLEWLTNSALVEMDTACKGTHEDNALALAEAGMLPMYGLPSVVRKFYHSAHTEEIERNKTIEVFDGIIDRPIEQAITEFAPGAMKTKDGAEYISAGLTVPLDHLIFCRDAGTLQFNSEALDPLQYSSNITLDGTQITSIEPYNSSVVDQVSVFRLVVPKAFRTDLLIGNKGKTNAEDEGRSNFMPVAVWVDVSAGSYHSSPQGAMSWCVWNASNSQNKSNVWYVNLNKGQLFTGKRMWKEDRSGNRFFAVEPKFFSRQTNPTSKQGLGYLPNQNKEGLINYAPNFMIDYNNHRKWYWNESNKEETIALGAKKITDIMCLTIDPAKIPNEINLDANCGNRSAIIASMYSAATLIQRTFADKVDIDPEEIEISEVKIDPINGLPSVFLNDKAANGAGFISQLSSVNPKTNKVLLMELMEDIVSDHPTSSFINGIREHAEMCDTSCARCINTFYNRGLHHVLDWRLGMDIIKLMLDQTYVMGYYDLSDTPYHDLSSKLNTLGNRVQLAHPDGDTVYHSNDGHDWKTGYFTDHKGDKKEHLVHPLWNVVDQEAADGYKAQNSFSLNRTVKSAPVTAPKNNASTSTSTSKPASGGDPSNPTVPSSVGTFC